MRTLIIIIALAVMTVALNAQEPDCYSDDLSRAEWTTEGFSSVDEGIDGNDLVSDIRIMPNPSSGICRIKLDILRTSDITIKIYNSISELVDIPIVGQKHFVGELEIEYDAGSLSSGIYYVRIMANGRTLGSDKLVLKK